SPAPAVRAMDPAATRGCVRPAGCRRARACTPPPRHWPAVRCAGLRARWSCRRPRRLPATRSAGARELTWLESRSLRLRLALRAVALEVFAHRGLVFAQRAGEYMAAAAVADGDEIQRI